MLFKMNGQTENNITRPKKAYEYQKWRRWIENNFCHFILVKLGPCTVNGYEYLALLCLLESQETAFL
jgi:hypothetical protein